MNDKFTKCVDMSNVTDNFTKEQIKKGVTSVFCQNVNEKIPEFDIAPCEKKSKATIIVL